MSHEHISVLLPTSAGIANRGGVEIIEGEVMIDEEGITQRSGAS